MKKSRFHFAVFWLIASFSACSAQKPQQQSYNFSLEQQDTLHKPLGWSFSFGSGNYGYISRPDSIVTQEGKYSVFITKSDTSAKGTFGVCRYSFPARFEGKMIKLTGYLKLKDVKEGFAGLWLRVEDAAHNIVGFDNMESQGITGTRDWAKYSIEFPYNGKEAAAIVVGALLTGSGQLWMDNLEVTIDGLPLAKVPERQVVLSKTDKDTQFDKVRASGSLCLRHPG